MRRLLLIKILLITFSSALFAGSKYYRSDEIIFNINYNSWLQDHPSIQTKVWPSLGFDFNWVMDYPISKESPFSFAFGLGFSTHHVYHNADLRLNTSLINHEGNFELSPLVGSYSTNKLVTNYIELPIEFRYRNHNKSPFRAYLGFKGGYMLHHSNKYSNNVLTYKSTNIHYLNRWRYGPTLRIGYGLVNFHAYYSLNSIFRKGSPINELAIGISIFAN